MNSFIGISRSHTTNLAVVAPGIAEALLATAIGLVAAIPAVIVYNIFARSIAGYRAMLAGRFERGRCSTCRAISRAAAATRREGDAEARRGHSGGSRSRGSPAAGGVSGLGGLAEGVATMTISLKSATSMSRRSSTSCWSCSSSSWWRRRSRPSMWRSNCLAPTREAQPRPDKPVFLTVKSDLALALGDDPVASRRAAVGTGRGDRRRPRASESILRADRAVAYGELMKVMNLLREDGYLKIALVGLR